MITVKLLGHKDQVQYDITSRAEGIKLFKDISTDGEIMDPVEVYKGLIIAPGKTVTKEDTDIIEIPFVMSDGGLDRDDERILIAGWDLKNYKLNPVLQWAHDGKRPAIGNMKSITTKDNLAGIAVFAPKSVDHFAWSIGMKVSLGIISAGSVGFFPKKYAFIDDKNDPAWLEFQEQELLEFSICNVPSNPRALINQSVIDTNGKSMQEMADRLTGLEEMLKTLKGKNVEIVISEDAPTGMSFAELGKILSNTSKDA